jgi:hypothetical protein
MSNAGGITVSSFKLFCRPIALKWYSTKTDVKTRGKE